MEVIRVDILEQNIPNLSDSWQANLAANLKSSVIQMIQEILEQALNIFVGRLYFNVVIASH
jgi:hypothetical protein